MAWKDFRNGRKKPWIVRWGYGGPGESKSFKTEKQADLFIEQNVTSEEELPKGFSVSPDERAAILRLRKIGSVDSVLRFAEDNYKTATSGLTLQEARDRFIAARKERNLRTASIKMYKGVFKQTENVHPKVKVADFSKLHADAVINASYKKDAKGTPVQYSAGTKEKIVLVYRILFNWLMAEGFCSNNPFWRSKKTERLKDKKPISIISVADMKAFI